MIEVSLNLETVLGFALGGLGITVTIMLVFKPDLIMCTFGLASIKCEFRKKTQQAEELLGLAAIPQQPASSQTTQGPAHEIVNYSWNLLNNAVRSWANALPNGPPSGASIPELIGALQNVGVVSQEQARYLSLLYDIGQEIAGTSGAHPFKRDAAEYWELVQSAVHWLKSIKKSFRVDLKPKPPSRRYTQVGGYGVFPPPASGQPAVMLVATSGPVQGKSFPVEQERFHIGAGPENDLVIDGDEFVSERHAYLQFQDGSLFLFDADSRNGTFLNDRRLTSSGMTLAVGDHLRVGETTFRVEQADRVGAPESGQAGAESGRGKAIQGYVP